MEDAEAIINKLINDLDEYLFIESQEMDQYLNTNQATYIKAARIIIIVGLILAFSLIFGGFLYVKEITQPIKQLSQMAKKVALGDLSVKTNIKTRTQDEIKDFSKSFNNMIGILEKTTVSRAYFNHVLNRMADTLIITDTAGKIKIVNKAAINLLEYTEEELLGKPFAEILSKKNENTTVNVANITSPSNNGWWIEIPEKNKLNISVKNDWELIAGPVSDNTERVSLSWEINNTLDDSDFGIYVIHKEDILACDFTGINDIIDRLSRNRESLLKNRGTLEVLISGYDQDPREAYEIPEIRHWYCESIKAGVPWFYFLGKHANGMGLTVLLFSYCCIKIKIKKVSCYALFYKPDVMPRFTHLFCKRHIVRDQIRFY